MALKWRPADPKPHTHAYADNGDDGIDQLVSWLRKRFAADGASMAGYDCAQFEECTCGALRIMFYDEAAHEGIYFDLEPKEPGQTLRPWLEQEPDWDPIFRATDVVRS